MTARLDERPKSWANWRAHLERTQARSGHKFDLYSDSVIHGMARDFGPYRLMNLIVGERRETPLARPVMTLRVRYAANPNPQDEDAEQGKRHPNEVAALVALVLGIRLQAGGETRHFDFWDKEEPLDGPRAQAEVQTPVMLPATVSAQLERVRRLASTREADMDRIELLERPFLGKALRGELVPQDQNDEPADVMVARTAAGAQNPAQPSKRGRKKAS